MVVRGFWCGSELEGLGYLSRGVGYVSIGGGGFSVGVVGGGWSQSHREEQIFFLAEVCEFGVLEVLIDWVWFWIRILS